MIDEVVQALPAGTGHVLDLASGPGEPACLIATALPSSAVFSTDFSAEMVQKALKRSEG